MALYSVLLGVLDLPCITDSCGEVMNSRYGKLFGFPVGLYALPLWLGLLAPSVWIKRGSCGLLVAGSVFFVLIQAFVLQSFCVVCAAHAAAAFSLLVFRPGGETSSTPVFAGAIGSLALGKPVGSALKIKVNDNPRDAVQQDESALFHGIFRQS